MFFPSDFLILEMYRADVADKTLTKCAFALHRGDLSRANSLLKEVLDLAALETRNHEKRRRIKYLAEALIRRSFRLHPNLSSLIDYMGDEFPRRVSPIQLANKAIETALVEKPQLHLHIIDLSPFYPNQWKDLISKLGLWSRETPLFRLSRIVSDEEEGTDEGEEEISNFAAREGIAFEFYKIVVNCLDEISSSLLDIRDDELVIVNFFFGLENSLVEAIGMRKLLVLFRGINPAFLVIRERYVEFEHSDSQDADFVQQYIELLKYRELDDFCYRNQIINMLRCDGVENRTLSQWQYLLKVAGFSPVPIKFTETSYYFCCKEEKGFVTVTAENEWPFFFLSVFKLDVLRPVILEPSEVGDLQRVSFKSDILHAAPLISSESASLIRMASLAEIYDMVQHVCIMYNVKALTWASCAYAAHVSNQKSCQLGSLLCVEESACYFPLFLGDLRVRRCHAEKGKGHIGKALESNQPIYIPDISQLAEDDCPYGTHYLKEIFFW